MRFEAGAAAAQRSPLSEIAPAESRKAEPPGVTGAAIIGARVLLVDDNAVNRQVVKLFLKPFGAEIREAANGQLALDLLRLATFDIILLDVHMPVMDGGETIKAIRSSGAAWSDVPTIALTADAMSGDRERYLEMGMNDYLSKPIDQRELISKMNVVLALRAGASPAAGKIPASA
jgi:CheY-like chemotaxis protein